LLLTGLKTQLWPGMTISLTFTFDRAGTVTVQVPVQLSKTPQTSVIPAPSTTGQPG
jgi:copper(I)-binding protein